MDHATLNQYFESNGGLLDHQHEDANKKTGPGVAEEVNIRHEYRHHAGRPAPCPRGPSFIIWNTVQER